MTRSLALAFERMALIAISALLVTGCTPAEDGLYRFTLITEGDHVVQNDETVQGDLIIVGGRVSVQSGSSVSGSLVMLSGNVGVDGLIEGDVLVINGTLRLGATAQVGGDVTASGGVLDRHPAATIGGDLTTVGPTGGIPNLAQIQVQSPREFALQALLTTVAMGLLGFIVGHGLPRPVTRISRAARDQPAVAGAVGVLVVLVGPSLLVLMVFTILLIPIAALGFLILGVAAVYGWIGLGNAVGQAISSILNWSARPRVTALLGTASLTFGLNVAGLVPLVGLVVGGLALSVALGAVVLTLFGRQDFVPATARDDTL